MLTATKTIKLETGLLINEYLLHENNPNKISLPSKRSKTLLGITIHNTGDLANVEDDAEQYTRATVNGNMSTVRSHYYVDDLSAWQNLDLDYQNWTNGDGTGPGNGQTIAIECIMSSSSEGDEMSMKARKNCAELTAFLLKKYGLTTDNIYTHSHWLHTADKTQGTREELNIKPHSYKTCPLYIIPNWSNFLAQVQSYMSNEIPPTTQTETETPTETETQNYLVRVTDPDENGLNVRTEPNFSAKIVATATQGIYTIVEEKTVSGTLFGKLKSGSGWIVIKPGFAEKV